MTEIEKKLGFIPEGKELLTKLHNLVDNVSFEAIKDAQARIEWRLERAFQHEEDSSLWYSLKNLLMALWNNKRMVDIT